MKNKEQWNEIDSQIEPEYVDCDGIRLRFGIKRSLAYKLMNEGKIKSLSLTSDGKIRGKRLFEVKSVREFLASCPK